MICVFWFWLENQVGLQCVFVPSWTLARKWDSRKARYWTLPHPPSNSPNKRHKRLHYRSDERKSSHKNPEKFRGFGFVYCSKFAYLKILRDPGFIDCFYILYCFRKALCDTDPPAKSAKQGGSMVVLKKIMVLERCATKLVFPCTLLGASVPPIMGVNSRVEWYLEFHYNTEQSSYQKITSKYL